MRLKKSLILLFIGTVFGLVLAVAAAYTFGAYESKTTMNIYTGEKWTDHCFLWHTWRSDFPEEKHTKWAKTHMNAKRTYWPVSVCAVKRKWFGNTVHTDGYARDIVREIYTLSVREKRKIELLHQFHRDITNRVAKDAKDPYQRLYMMWDNKLREAP